MPPSGGGLSNSSAASSGTGDQLNNAAFQGGNVNFGAGSGSGANLWLILGAAAIAAYLLLKKK
ncbi:hypothetical protein G3465_15180 [Shewanella baltica]|uniref:GlyGly-CTERM sorting domain-containing protein n=1 Tax=Shewanella scandinavica TaxID=3063538 RepID=A0ABU3FZI5_9GAMM|nr:MULTISPECIES: hypothetical protein [Shewanella]MCS6154235.1 hypothetical protein [Shewanella baltica]MCS6176750.1 hypothetical protein [Shewanella baltica]MCS6237988.1 hypothetical protein [Shewanella baltica]MCS6270895.1 hypothetical protein [Shewanella baltica]MDT3280472.1 hypothetical protein [Shewanella sp. SP2S1-2]